MKWIAENLGTIVVALVLLAMLGAAVGAMIRNKKNGKSACGCDCGSCGMHCGCGRDK